MAVVAELCSRLTFDAFSAVIFVLGVEMLRRMRQRHRLQQHKYSRYKGEERRDAIPSKTHADITTTKSMLNNGVALKAESFFTRIGCAIACMAKPQLRWAINTRLMDGAPLLGHAVVVRWRRNGSRLRRAWSAGENIKRVHKDLLKIRDLRNRIAHHEPIFAERWRKRADIVWLRLEQLSPEKHA